MFELEIPIFCRRHDFRRRHFNIRLTDPTSISFFTFCDCRSVNISARANRSATRFELLYTVYQLWSVREPGRFFLKSWSPFYSLRVPVCVVTVVKREQFLPSALNQQLRITCSQYCIRVPPIVIRRYDETITHQAITIARIGYRLHAYCFNRMNLMSKNVNCFPFLSLSSNQLRSSISDWLV